MASKNNPTANYSEDIASIYYLMDEVDKKKPLVIGPIAFFASLFLGLPFWLAILLPFTIFATSVNVVWVLLRGPKRIQSSVDDSNGDSDTQLDIKPLNAREYDLVLLGVTGFTGKLAASYLVKQYGVGKDAKVKWAVAGRSKAKIESTLKSIAKDLGSDKVLDVDIVIVDTSKRDTVKKMVGKTRAVATTAGPFVKYGSSVVELCAKNGTHYADITGEVDWNKDMMKLYESTARQTGAKIVSFCGHDSIPWDLTVRVLSEKLQNAGDKLVSVECLNEMQGGISGGTIATFFETIDIIFDQLSLSEVLSKLNALDVYMRLPDGSESKQTVRDNLPIVPTPCKNPSLRFIKKWASPFVMAYINIEVVRRGVALSSSSGSSQITYREAIAAENFMDAFSMLFGLVMIGTLIVNPITRPLLRVVVPQPGQGPSNKEMQDGYLCVTGYGVGSHGKNAECVMYFPYDGGYTSTARMLVESGLCLALDCDAHDSKDGGFYSPSSLMCHALLGRLTKTEIARFACTTNLDK